MDGFVGAVAIEVGKCIVEPIKRQFSYLCCFDTNIRNLRDEATKLKDAKVGVEGRVDAATRNVQVIVPQVQTWLDDVNNIQANMDTVETEIGNVKSGCLAIKSRFSLSRKATKMAAAMKELQDEHAKFGEICHPPPPAAMAPTPLGQTYELQSRKHLEDDIMATLREKKVSLMGICGMGGIGKTVMAKKIMSRAKGEGLFNEIVMAVVSQPIDMFRIQQEMTELLGLKLDVESVPARAHLLRARLMNTKGILIILDDLWKKLNLEDLGIPDQRELKECMILLTSRDRDVFNKMNVEKKFQMKTLKDEEAWSLFKEKVGACADDQSLISLAKEIVRECNGLPIALVTVGEALKDEINKFVWEDALQELRSGNPQDIPYFLAQVYNPLKLSFDLLESEHTQSIFLMCCLFPEDYNILISDLSLYAWGLDMFKGITSMQVARNKAQKLVNMLKTRSLLLDGFKDGFVKMHDVVRDVGIFIAGEKGLIDPNFSWKTLPREKGGCSINCTWISVFNADKMKLLRGFIFPNLRFLLMEGPYSIAKEELLFSDNFFESARKLNVLSIENYKLRSLAHTVQLQKDLRTLILRSCDSLGDISVVGELVSLEVLYCQDCESIKELPVEIGGLNQLKLLHISNCSNLKTIAAGVISELITLEELTLIDSFTEWEAVGGGEKAALCELNYLSNLTTLRIQIEDASLAAKQINLSSSLVEFNVQIGNPRYTINSYYRTEMQLELEREIIIGDWIHQLLRNTETLALQGDGTAKLVQLLPEIHKGPISSKILQELALERLPKLQHLGNNYLLQLKRISVRDCPMLEQVVLLDEEENVQSNRITFPKLETLILLDLPKLTSFCKGIQSIEFPLLTKMEILKCPSLKNIVSSGAMTLDDDDSLHIFCKSKVAFSKLKHLSIGGYEGMGSEISGLWCDHISKDFFTRLVKLSISDCGNIKSLFSLSVATNFVNLQDIEIRSCSMLEQAVLWNEDEYGLSSCVAFPKLKRLRVQDLPRLTSFCKGIQSIEFPLLTRMYIVNCPNLLKIVQLCSTGNDFTKCGDDDSMHLFCKPEEAAFPRLKHLMIYGYESISSLWCHQIPIDFFTQLVHLFVINCGNMKSLFSPSIAGNLLNLTELAVHSCGEMVKVLEDEEEVESRSPFIKLEVLYLTNLPKLKAFCDWRSCALHLPSLREVYIAGCPEMERFSLGSLTTPNLEYIFKNKDNISNLEDIFKNGKRISDYTKDLNDALFGGDFLHLDILFGSDDE